MKPIDKESYRAYAKRHASRSPLLRDCFAAFLVGGGICMFGQGLFDLYTVLGMAELPARTTASCTLILLAVVLTGLGVFDKIAKFAGAGTLVPITGFANAVVAPAIDTKAEGLVLGLGAKIFTIAGPVILYGTLASSIYGVLYYLNTLL